MKKIFVLLFLVAVLSTPLMAQDSSNTSKDYFVQKEIYSNLLGFEIDTMINPKLYRTISDWLFTAYKYGGRTKDGIDCSDFSSILYNDAYEICFKGSSADVFTQTVSIEKEELREGDLVFFKINKKHISHMGVYLTKNKFAHATVKSGVVVNDLDEDYYKKYFYKAGRLKNPQTVLGN